MPPHVKPFRRIAGLAWIMIPVAVPTGALPLITMSSPAYAQTSAAGLTFVNEVQLSPRLREFTLKTPLLVTRNTGVIPPNPSGETKVRILLPAGYDPNGTRRYPVLYLYHGGGGNQTEWTTPASKGKAEELTEALPLIVVMPEGGLAGGYADWYNAGELGPPQWKSYHLNQLIPWVDAHFRTIANRGGRASAGLSMGGGGLRYAAQRPDLFGATAAFSGDIDILQPASDWNGMGAMISKMIWGDRKTEEVRWRGVNGVDLAGNLTNTDVALFAGDTGRPEATYILPGTKAVDKALDRFGIAHRFTIYPGMTHSWPTWNKALADWLPHLMARFQTYNSGDKALAGMEIGLAKSDKYLPLHPKVFVYSSITPTYSLYGWTLRMERKAVEFSTLEVAGLHSFSILGSGSAWVITPPLGSPNARACVNIDGMVGAAPGKTILLKTDAQGRLAVPIQLGPANPFQQYSAEADAASTGAAVIETPFPQSNNGSHFYRVKVTLTLALSSLGSGSCRRLTALPR